MPLVGFGEAPQTQQAQGRGWRVDRLSLLIFCRGHVRFIGGARVWPWLVVGLKRGHGLVKQGQKAQSVRVVGQSEAPLRQPALGVQQLQASRPRMVAVLHAQPSIERPLPQALRGGRADIEQVQSPR